MAMAQAMGKGKRSICRVRDDRGNKKSFTPMRRRDGTENSALSALATAVTY